MILASKILLILNKGMPKNTFHKSERLSSLIAIDRLFNGGSRSFSAFPIRIVYRLEEMKNTDTSNVEILVTVSKRHFHHAVQRNRVKRQIREAYRANRTALKEAIVAAQKRILIAFIWQDDKLWESQEINERVQKLLDRVAEKINRTNDSETVE